MKQFISIADVVSIPELIEKCLKIKANAKSFRYNGEGKILTNIFFNPSLRTRLSMEKAGRNMSMEVITMEAAAGWNIEFEDGAKMEFDSAEHVKEAAGVLSQYTDILAIRSFPSLTDQNKDYQDQVIHSFAKYASVPVISLESATRHPLQSLADCITIAEQSSRPKPRVVLTWAPHPHPLPQSVPNSFAEWMRDWGEVELVITNPPGMDLSPEFTEGITIEHDQDKALAGADFVYAKNWSSFSDYGTKYPQDGSNWMITEAKMALTNNGKFMHCLPVRRNVVVADDVLDCDQSLVMEQAKNRVWAAQGVLAEILEAMQNDEPSANRTDQ